MNERPEPATVPEPPAATASLRGPLLQRLGTSASTADLLELAYDAHQRELYSFALGATHDPAAAEDVVQEAFLRLVREVGARRTPDNVRAWLYRVAANLVMSRGRRTAVADRFRALLVDRENVDPPEREYLRREMSDSVHEALAELPRDARVGLLMAAHGFSGREIAVAIGRTENATRTLMCRARLDLRSRLSSVENSA